MTLSAEVYLCSAGETFDSVALSVYGDEKYACELLSANPALSRTPVFSGGERLALPVVAVVTLAQDTAQALPMSAVAPWKE